MSTLVCRKCKYELPKEEFQVLKDRKGNHTWQRKVCKSCDSIRKKKTDKAYRQRHPDRIKARMIAFETKNKIKRKIYHCYKNERRRQDKRDWFSLHELRTSLLEEWNSQFAVRKQQLDTLVSEQRITEDTAQFLMKLWEINEAPSLSPLRKIV